MIKVSLLVELLRTLCIAWTRMVSRTEHLSRLKDHLDHMLVTQLLGSGGRIFIYDKYIHASNFGL